MAPPLIVRAVLDAKAYLTMADSVVSSNTLMGDSALAMGADMTKSAQASVAAGVKVIQSQRLQVAEYTKLAAAATAGSDAAIVAAAKRDRAQAALNRSLGISTVATGTLAKEEKTAERDLGKLTRGALAGSGVFSKLGRSLAFASSGFIAVAGGATVISLSIKQAEGLAAAQRQVDQQLKVSGKSWAQYGTQINAALLKEGRLAGFTRSDLLQAFGYLIRVGGNVRQSLNLTGLAADVARGRSISLQAASISLSKALGGSATALRRLGIIVPKNVTTMQALAYVQKKFAGQAEAGTTESQRLSASLADAGATIGTVLLPTFDRLATKAANWLHRMNESGKLTKDFAGVTHLLGVGFHIAGGIIATVDKITGGFAHTLLILGEVWGTIKIVGWISSLQKLAVSWGLVASAAEKAAAAEAAAAAVSASGIATGDLRAASMVANTSLLGRLGSGVRGLSLGGRAGLGGAIAIGGQLLGPQVGNLIGGQAGQATSSAIKYGSLGAGIGMLFGPEGAVAGGVLGTIVGGLKDLVHISPSVQQSLTADANSMQQLASAAKQAAGNIADIKLTRLQLEAQLPGQELAVTQAKQFRAGTQPGTGARLAADQALQTAELNLAQTRRQLGIATGQLATAEKNLHDIQAKRKQLQADEIQKVEGTINAYKSLYRALAQHSVTKSADIATLNESVRSGADKATTAVGAIRIELQRMASQSEPGLAKILTTILTIAKALGHLPTPKQIELIFKSKGDVTLGPNGQLIPFNPNKGPVGPLGPIGPGSGNIVKPLDQYTLSLQQQIAQVQAQMTTTLGDDVKVAKMIIATIKTMIASGKLVKGTQAYLQGLQEMLTEMGVLQTAAQQAAAKRQAAAQKALEIASTYETPINLQIAQVRAEMTKSNKDDIGVLKKIIAAARSVLASGSKNKKGQLALLETILQAQQALQQLTGSGDNNTFTLPLKLQLALAKSQALGTDQAPILHKMKAALEKALKAAKGNLQKQIDIWNQIGSINQQMQSDVTNAYGKYRKASLAAETAGLGLTAAQRRALEERLSQKGPGGTVPSVGVGAGGYIIDPETGRPITSGHHRRRYRMAGGGGGSNIPDWVIKLIINIDGKKMTEVVTRRQQRYRGSNPQSRRGPHAATATA